MYHVVIIAAVIIAAVTSSHHRRYHLQYVIIVAIITMIIVIIVLRAAIRIQLAAYPLFFFAMAMVVRIADTHSGQAPLPGVLMYAYRRDWLHQGRMGVLILNSTAASNRAANDLREYEAFFLRHAGGHSPLGSVRQHEGTTLGLVKDVFPQMQPQSPGDHTCIHYGLWRGARYKGVFGYGAQNAGMDRIHHCVDAYFQGPNNESW